MKLRTLVVALALVATSAASPAFAQAPAAARAAQAQEPTGADAVVALVNAGISEAFILKSIQNGGTAYNLTPADLVRLKTAGASDRVIEAMLSPTMAAAPVAVAPTPAAAPAAAPQQAPSGKPSFMRRLGDRLAATAEQTVDNVASSAASAADNASAKATGAVDKKLGVVSGKPAAR